MEFIELHHELCVQPIHSIPELVVLLNFCREKISDTPAIIIVYEALLRICLIDQPTQNLNGWENWSSTSYHVQTRPLNVWETLIIEHPYIRVDVWDILQVILSINSIE